MSSGPNYERCFLCGVRVQVGGAVKHVATTHLAELNFCLNCKLWQDDNHSGVTACIHLFSHISLKDHWMPSWTTADNLTSWSMEDLQAACLAQMLGVP